MRCEHLHECRRHDFQDWARVRSQKPENIAYQLLLLRLSCYLMMNLKHLHILSTIR